MKKKRKWIIPAVIIPVIAVIAAVVLNGRNKGEALPLVRTETVARQDLESTVTIKGTVTGTDSASVYSKSNNRIASIPVKEGDYVTVGQVLCELERDESTDILLEKAEIELDQAARNEENVQFLYENGAASEEEAKQASNAKRLAELNLEELKREATASVTSPIDGTVTRVNTAVGKLAGGSNAEALFQIENIDKLQMRLPISEYDISSVRVGQDVRITSEAIGKKKMHGRVESIAPTGEQKQNASGIEMVVPIVVAVDPEEKDLFAGVTARAEIVTGSIPNALAVPVDAIAEDGETGQTYVFTVQDGVLKKSEVTVLLEGSFYSAIAEDGAVKEGDQIVLMPAADLEGGMNVSAEAAEAAE